VRISKHEEFGLRLVAGLAQNGGKLNIRELAEHEGLPETTVAKVIARLRRGGLVEAERGRNGGYSLVRPADQITLAQVVEAFGNRVYDGEFCDRMNPDGDCNHNRSCGLRPVWRGLGAVVGEFLDGFTVADIVHGRSPSGDLPANRGALPVIEGYSS
jgi:Rrf2 family protein